MICNVREFSVAGFIFSYVRKYFPTLLGWAAIVPIARLPNGSAAGDVDSVVFAGLTVTTNRQTDRETDRQTDIISPPEQWSLQ